MRLGANTARALLLAYLLFLAFLVFTPRPDLDSPIAQTKFGGTSLFEIVLHSILYLKGLFEGIANIFLLLPFAFLLKKLFVSLTDYRLITYCLALSIAIEIGQSWVPGRVSDYRDVLANTSGVIAFLYFARLFERKRGLNTDFN